MSERGIKAGIRLALGRGATRVFNNPVGVAIYPDGSRVPYGLVPGAADLIGWCSIEVTPDMVGKRVAVFTAIETKAPRGRRAAHQRNFIEAVRDAGGYAGFARTTEEAKKILEGE